MHNILRFIFQFFPVLIIGGHILYSYSAFRDACFVSDYGNVAHFSLFNCLTHASTFVPSIPVLIVSAIALAGWTYWRKNYYI